MLSRVFFRIVGIVMIVAPIGAFGAMAYTIGTFGAAALLPLGRLMLGVYMTMALFIFVVLNLILRAYGFRLWEYLAYIREEIVIVLGTSSSEAALPGMLAKMERYGCAKPVVGPGDSSGLFVQSRRHVDLPVDGVDLHRAGVRRSPRRWAAARAARRVDADVQGRGWGDGIRLHRAREHALRASRRAVEGIALVLGVDRFMSEARAITNLIGNGVATLVVARSERAFDDGRRQHAVAALRDERAARRRTEALTVVATSTVLAGPGFE